MIHRWLFIMLAKCRRLGHLEYTTFDIGVLECLGTMMQKRLDILDRGFISFEDRDQKL
jgi:hypothetical protein